MEVPDGLLTEARWCLQTGRPQKHRAVFSGYRWEAMFTRAALWWRGGMGSSSIPGSKDSCVPEGAISLQCRDLYGWARERRTPAARPWRPRYQDMGSHVVGGRETAYLRVESKRFSTRLANPGKRRFDRTGDCLSAKRCLVARRPAVGICWILSSQQVIDRLASGTIPRWRTSCFTNQGFGHRRYKWRGATLPDGRQIVFQSNRSGHYQLWKSDANGANPVQLTSSESGQPGTPRWSPDGNWIAFDNYDEKYSHIYVIDAEGRNLRRVTSGDCKHVVPSWSRDGGAIYFASDLTGDFQVWRHELSTGKETLITHRGGFAAFEAYDAKTLYYTKFEGGGIWSVSVNGGRSSTSAMHSSWLLGPFCCDWVRSIFGRLLYGAGSDHLLLWFSEPSAHPRTDAETKCGAVVSQSDRFSRWTDADLCAVWIKKLHHDGGRRPVESAFPKKHRSICDLTWSLSGSVLGMFRHSDAERLSKSNATLTSTKTALESTAPTVRFKPQRQLPDGRQAES